MATNDEDRRFLRNVPRSLDEIEKSLGGNPAYTSFLIRVLRVRLSYHPEVCSIVRKSILDVVGKPIYKDNPLFADNVASIYKELEE